MIKNIGEIRDPIHGYIYISEVEKEIIDARPIQRLKRIKQLSGAHFTYPGAEHSRFSHSLGAMYLAGILGSHLEELGYINEDDIQEIRIAGLLHDAGHGPFSHTFEEVLDKYRSLTHEDITQWLIKGTEIKDIIEKHGYSSEKIAKLAVGQLEAGEKSYLSQVIASQFDVDIMDYLIRDSYFTGVEYGKVDVNRLIHSIDIIDNRLAMDVTTLYALEAFIIARYEMFKAVYFHRTVRAAEIMITRAMNYANEALGFTSFKTTDEYLQLDDSNILFSLSTLKNTKDKRLKVAHEFGKMYNNRQLLKCTYEMLIHHKTDFFNNIMSKEEIRDQIVMEISKKSDVNSEYIIIDVPTASSVPYFPLQKRPTDIPVFEKLPDESKRLHNLSEYSHLIDALIGYIDVVRVYTMSQFREKVREASTEVFGKQPYSSKISM